MIYLIVLVTLMFIADAAVYTGAFLTHLEDQKRQKQIDDMFAAEEAAGMFFEPLEFVAPKKLHKSKKAKK